MASDSPSEEERAEQEEKLLSGHVWKWYAYCPLGGSCRKNGAPIGGFFSEARAKKAVLNHLVGSRFHCLSQEQAEIEASAVRSVMEFQCKDNALSDGDDNRSQRSDGDMSRRSQRDRLIGETPLERETSLTRATSQSKASDGRDLQATAESKSVS